VTPARVDCTLDEICRSTSDLAQACRIYELGFAAGRAHAKAAIDAAYRRGLINGARQLADDATQTRDVLTDSRPGLRLIRGGRR
jgi:hypothetical protein